MLNLAQIFLFLMQINTSPPVIIGGVGGSGTRLVASLLLKLGYWLGSDLNESLDNLWFTLLFKRLDILDCTSHDFEQAVSIFIKRMSGNPDLSSYEVSWIQSLASADREQHNSIWLKARADSLFTFTRQTDMPQNWGWKEPNSHIILDRLNHHIMNLRYIHVMRNGFDMAFSNNQNQLKLWGPTFLGDDFGLTPAHSLKFWCLVHRRIDLIGRQMGDRFLMVNYDDLCKNPTNQIKQLIRFLNPFSYDEESLLPLLNLIRPLSHQRPFHSHAIDIFDPEDVFYVKSLGFHTRLPSI